MSPIGCSPIPSQRPDKLRGSRLDAVGLSDDEAARLWRLQLPAGKPARAIMEAHEEASMRRVIRDMLRRWVRRDSPHPVTHEDLVAGRFKELPQAPGSPIVMHDEFLVWLSFANAGMLHAGNAFCFDYAIHNLPSEAPIIEIGAFCGLSTNALAYFKRRNGVANRLITCDKWVFEGAVMGTTLGRSNILHDAYQAFVKETFRRNVEQFSRDDLPCAVEMFSDEFFAAWREKRAVNDVFGRPVQLGGPISFAYIDGNHTYEFARRDFDNCDQCLEPGGFILFDDSADGSAWEVCRVVQEVAVMGRYDLVIKNPNYLFRKRR